MKHEIVNFGLSARQRLLNIARQKGVQLEYVLLRYALERFLFRLGISKFSQQFILKGATAFAIWMGPFGRVTRDVDLEVYGDSKPETVLMAFREICTLPCPEDGVEFDGASFSTEAIKQEDKYPGIRLMFTATIGGAKVHLKFDIGCGDSVYPTAEQMEYPTLLGGEPPNIRIYPRYTIVAEKLQVMGYWGSTTESYLLSVFVLPEVQGRGIGRRIIETLEADEFFKRAWRTEVGSSLTAVGFYQKMGYAFKNGVATPDEFGVVRLEKRRGG